MNRQVALPDVGGKTWGLRFTHRAFAAIEAALKLDVAAVLNVPATPTTEAIEAVYLAGMTAWARHESRNPPTLDDVRDVLDAMPRLVALARLSEALRLAVFDPDRPPAEPQPEAATSAEGKPPATP